MQRKFKLISRIQSFASDFISKYPIYSGVLVLGSGTVIAQIITVLTMPVITRLYTPSDFGTLATYVSMLSIIAVAASFRYNIALVLPKDVEEAATLFWLCMISIAVEAVFFSAFILFSKDLIMEYLHLAQLGEYVWLLVIGFLGFGLYETLSYWAVRNRDYNTITSTKVNQSISGAICKIILGFFAFGPLGLIIGHIVSQIFGIEAFIRKIWEKDLDVLKKPDLKQLVNVSKKHKSFPIYNFPGAIINAISLQIPVFMLLATYDVQTVGLYSLAYNLLVLPGSFISSSLAQAFIGDASKLLREGNLELRSLYLSTVKHMSFIAIPLFGVISLSAPILFPLVFGDVWKSAGNYCLPLSLMVIPNFVFSPTSKLSIYGYNNWSFVWNLARTIAVVAGFYVSRLLMLSVMMNLTIYGLIMLVMYLINFWMNLEAISILTKKGDLKN